MIAPAMAYKLVCEVRILKDATSVSTASEFSRQIHEIFQQRRPTRIIETGTFEGTGTTAIIGSAIKSAGIQGAEFFSIEVDPEHLETARRNVQEKGIDVRLKLGLSIPRRLLLTKQQIHQQYVLRVVDGIHVEYSERDRAGGYFQETDFADVPDDVLGELLAYFSYQPHFVLLDSAGHLGYVEFQYVIGRLKGPCVLALDDTKHVKHFESVLKIKADARFKVLAESDERFGFCIAEFNP